MSDCLDRIGNGRVVEWTCHCGEKFTDFNKFHQHQKEHWKNELS